MVPLKLNKGRKSILIGILFLFFVSFTGLFLYGEQIYHFKALDYRIETTKDGFHKILMDEYFSYGVPGYPDLPSKIHQIAVPPDIDLNSIEVEFHESGRTSLGVFHVKELPPMVTWVDGERIIGEKTDIYSRDFYYPEKIVEYLGISQMRKWRIVNVKYTPFRYNPVTKDLAFVPEVTLVIRYSRSSMRALSDTELIDTVMDRRAKKILTNYSEAKEWYAPKRVVLTSLQTYNYVIVTTNAIYTASTKLSDFINYLTDKGYSVKVITETDFEVLTGQFPNTKAEKIREWLKNNYVSMGIEYVLLIGNPSPYESGEGDIPMKMCWPRNHESSDREAPTDYFYADLTGNWDMDGDGYFGEFSDDRGIKGVDFTNEIYVGRIPVYEGVSDLDSVLSKIISYGNATNTYWRLNALLPMSFSDSYTDGAYLGEAMKLGYLSSSDYSSYTLYMQGSLCPEADSLFSSDDELLDGVVKTYWMNNPFGMVWWDGHGNVTKAVLGYTGCGTGIIMTSSDAPSLNDNFPSFVYQGSCLNGYPEASNNLGTALLYNGAIATVSASRVSWYNEGSWRVDMKYECDIASIGYYYGQGLVSHGKKAAVALYDIKSDMGINGWGGTSWMNLFDFNLYGSPETYNIKVEYNLDISANQGGTVSPSPGIYTYLAGTEIIITATPDTNYRFSGWTGDVPLSQKNHNPLTITMDSDKSITANFVQQYTYTLTIAAGTGGTTDPEPDSYEHYEGTEVTITAIPNSGYEFTGWSGNASGITNPINITMDSDKSVKANFSAIPSDDGEEPEKKESCFIATAAYGSPLHPHIDILRDFRDQYLVTNKIGQALVNFYYRYSPGIANFISKYKILKIAVRIHLRPLISLSYLIVH